METCGVRELRWRCPELRTRIVSIAIDAPRGAVRGGTTIDELGARRAGRREANLRGLNERIADAQQEAGMGADMLRLVCECALRECEDAITVPTSVFEQARDAGPRFIVSPGHVLHEIERAVDAGEGWTIVEKLGPAADAAHEVQQ